MAFMSILVMGGIFLIVWLSAAAFLGLIGLMLFLMGLIPYHRNRAGCRKTVQYIKMTVGIFFLVAALFGLCILFPFRIFATCLAALAGIIVLCLALPKRIALESGANHLQLNNSIFIGIALIIASITYMIIFGFTLVITVIKAVVSS